MRSDIKGTQVYIQDAIKTYSTQLDNPERFINLLPEVPNHRKNINADWYVKVKCDNFSQFGISQHSKNNIFEFKKVFFGTNKDRFETQSLAEKLTTGK